MPCLSIPSPIGRLTIEEEGDAIVAIRWADARRDPAAGNGSAAARRGGGAARRLFRREADPVRPAARARRLAVRDACLDGNGGNPVRRDALLRGSCGNSRLGAARGRPGLRQEPDPDRDPLPSRAGEDRTLAATAARAVSRRSGVCSSLKGSRSNFRAGAGRGEDDCLAWAGIGGLPGQRARKPVPSGRTGWAPRCSADPRFNSSPRASLGSVRGAGGGRDAQRRSARLRLVVEVA